MRPRLQLRHLHILEAILIGVFFVQGLRFLIGTLYSHSASAILVSVLDPASIPLDAPGVVDPSVFNTEILLLEIMIALPLLTLLLGRVRWIFFIAALLVVVGRVLMNTSYTLTPGASSGLVVGGGLLYLAMLVRHRAQILPYLFLFGLGIDQLFRAAGDTLDPSWSPNYLGVQIALSVFTGAISLITAAQQRRPRRTEQGTVSPDYGLLPFWGGVGLGALLFLELALLAMPNAIARRAGTDYTLFAPFVLAATLLPLVPWIRGQARGFIALFEGGLRGWAWMLLLMLVLVFGTRFQGPVAGAALVAAQFAASMMWWWLVRPQAEKERNFTGLWVAFAALMFALLVTCDIFTYEYAYVRSVPDYPLLNNTVVPLLRGFRGLGLGVLLLSAFLAALPIIQTPRRIPWTIGTRGQSLAALLLLVVGSLGVAYAARPPLIVGVRNVESIRIGTYNIHSGFSEFFSYELQGIAGTIDLSGANVVLLQEVEAGRMTSFGVDQPLWLARRLGMDTRFYPTNEGLQGLAVLSDVEIVFHDGNLLTSIGNQTGVQRVQIRPDTGVVTIYNTWLGLLVAGEGERSQEDQEQDQQRQLEEIFALILAHHPGGQLGRTVIGGTFNNVPDSPLIQQMRNAGFIDPSEGAAFEPSATLWRTDRRGRLDYLWIRSLGPFGTGVIESNASDHRLLVVEVLLRP